jgi:hypothetical protein
MRKSKSIEVVEELIEPTRVKTVYVDYHNNIVKTNNSKNLNQSIATCVLHMQINQYGAKYAEILDADTEQLFGVVTRNIQGDIKIIYKWDPASTERKYGVTQLLK